MYIVSPLCTSISLYYFLFVSLQWRHNELDGVSNHQPHDCLLNRLFTHRSKKSSKLRVTGLCVGNSPMTGEFPAQMASNAENVSIGWRHHDANVMLVDVNGSSASPVCYRSHHMKNIWKKYLEDYDTDKLTLETKQNTSQVGRKNIAICVSVLRSHTYNSYVSVVPLITQWSQWHYMLVLRWRHNERGCVSNHQPHDCLLNRLFRHRSKKTSKLRATGLCAGNSSGTGDFPAQMASNAEDVSIWWRHHGWILVWYRATNHRYQNDHKIHSHYQVPPFIKHRLTLITA